MKAVGCSYLWDLSHVSEASYKEIGGVSVWVRVRVGVGWMLEGMLGIDVGVSLGVVVGMSVDVHECWLDLCATASSTRLINS